MTDAKTAKPFTWREWFKEPDAWERLKEYERRDAERSRFGRWWENTALMRWFRSLTLTQVLLMAPVAGGLGGLVFIARALFPQVVLWAGTVEGPADAARMAKALLLWQAIPLIVCVASVVVPMLYFKRASSRWINSWAGWQFLLLLGALFAAGVVMQVFWK
jgi:hypothetical protein